jgi:WD40 repeat protein
MKKTLFPFLTLVLLSSALAQEPISITELVRKDPVDFGKEVFPLFKKNCIACHNSSKAKGQLNLEDPKAILKGGSEGPAIVAGKPDESFLLQVAAHLEDPIMPPEKNKANAIPFTPDELGLIKRWIEEGGKGEAPLATVTPEKWVLSKRQDYPVYHMALSSNDHFVAASRGQRVHLYDLRQRVELGQLNDPALASQDIYKKETLAHQDFVQSIAFSSDGWMATGGFRNAKLWKPVVKKGEVCQSLPEAVTAVTVTRDGQWIAAGDSSGHVTISKAGSQASPSKRHEGSVVALALSLDGGLVASAGADGKIRIVSASSQEPVHHFTTEEVVKALLLLPEHLVVATESGKLLLGALVQGELESIPGHEKAIVALESHPSAMMQIFTGSLDGTVKHWELGENKVVRSITHGDPVSDLSVSPDGQHLISLSASAAKVWKVEDGSHLGDLALTPEEVTQNERLKRAESTSEALVDNRKKKFEERQKAWRDEVEKAKKAATDRLAAMGKWDESDLAAHQARLSQLKSKANLDDVNAEVASLKKAKETEEAQAKALGEDVKQEREQRAGGLAETAAQAKMSLDQCKSEITTQTTIKEKLRVALPALKVAKVLLGEEGSADKVVIETENLLAEAQRQLSMLEIKLHEAKKAEQIATAALLKLEQLEMKHAKAKEAVEATKARFAQTEERSKKAAEAHKKVEEALTKANEALKNAAKANGQAIENEELAIRLSQRASEAQTRAQTALTLAEAKLKVSQEALKAGAEIETGPLTSIAFAVEGKTFAVGRAKGDTLLYATEDRRLVGSIEGSAGTCVYGLAGGNWLTCREKSLLHWTTKAAWEWTQTIGKIDDPKALVDRVTALAFSPNGTVLATGSGSPSRSGELKFWRVADGSLLLEVEDAHSDTIVGVEFSPDGRYVATASTDRFSKVFEVSDGGLVAAFEGHTSHVLDVSWRADGLVLATAGADKVIKLWDFEEKRQIKTIDGYNQEITSVAFADTAETLVTSSGDKTVRFGKERFDGKEFVYASAMSQDGQWLVAGTQDSVVRVWQAKDKKLVQEFTAPVK